MESTAFDPGLTEGGNCRDLPRAPMAMQCKRTPERHQDPVLRAWLEIGFTPKGGTTERSDHM